MSSDNLIIPEQFFTVSQTRAETDMQLVSIWLGAQEDRSPHTLRAYERVAGRFLAALGVSMRQAKLEDIKNAINVFRVTDNGQPSSAATVGTYFGVVRSLFGFAHEVGYCQFNVTAAIKSKKGFGDRGRAQRIISEADAQAVINATRTHRDKLMMQVAYYGGLRVSELVGLTWAMVTPRDGGKVQLTVNGKGGKERQVMLPENVGVPLLESRMLSTHNDLVFNISDRQFNYIVKEAAKQAGVNLKMSPHWLRHAHASHALDNGVPISLVSHTLGHSDISTTGIYVHARPGDSSGLYLKK